MNRREFSTFLSVLVAAPAVAAVAKGEDALQIAAPYPLASLASGDYPPGPATAVATAPHISHRYILGMLPDNIRLEAHDSWLAPGAPPEAIGHHQHSEIWFVREGEATLMTAGKSRTLKAGDMGLCVAGESHYIANASRTAPVSYLVLAVGPPE